MTRILMRGYAHPFEPLDPLAAISGRSIGQNSGNLIFTASVLRALMRTDVEVDIESSASLASRADEINEKYDHVALPFANAFRPGFVDYLDKYADLIERLRIPVTVVGIGAQGTLDYDWTRLDAIEPHVRRFVSAILDRGPSIGVRGDMTRRYLNSLGFSDVVTIGCPSMYMHGSDLHVSVPKGLRSSSRIALNLTPRVPMPQKFNTKHLAKYPDTMYVAQDQADLEMMLGGSPVNGDSDYPGSLFHPLLSRDRTVMYLNAQQWISEMAQFDFAFGSRIHGNVAALLAGTPGHVIAHDSRTRELAAYFEIPHTLSVDLDESTSAESLFEKSDWKPMMAGHRGRFERYVRFLDEHRLPHAFDQSPDQSEFDFRTAQSGIGAESKVTVRSLEPSHMLARHWMTAASLQKKVAGLERTVRSLRRSVNELAAGPETSVDAAGNATVKQPLRSVRAVVDRLRGR